MCSRDAEMAPSGVCYIFIFGKAALESADVDSQIVCNLGFGSSAVGISGSECTLCLSICLSVFLSVLLESMLSLFPPRPMRSLRRSIVLETSSAPAETFCKRQKLHFSRCKLASRGCGEISKWFKMMSVNCKKKTLRCSKVSLLLCSEKQQNISTFVVGKEKE